MAALSPPENLSLKQSGFGAILALKQVKLEIGFLDAYLEFWDPDMHVFRFPFGELCPLPEEFGAIGGWSRTTYPVEIPWAMSFRSRFKGYVSIRF